MLLNSHISAYARCVARKVCGLVRSTWGTSRVEDKLGARDRILTTTVALVGRSTFFNALKWWPTTPFRMNNPQPNTTSAAEHGPHFAGDPPWRPEEAKALVSQWLQVRIATIYKSGPLEAAHNYQPISVATGMYSIPARLVLDRESPLTRHSPTPKQDVGEAILPHNKPSACRCFYTNTGTGR